MPRLDLPALRAFVAIAEERSIRRAAERLHLSQPPLTRRVRALEALLGTALLLRSSTGVTLTAAGQHLLRRARRLLAEADLIEAEIRGRAAGVPGVLRVGLSAGLPRQRTERLVAAWGRALADRRLEVRTDFTLPLLEALRAGELAFAVVGLPANLAGLRAREVFAEPMVAALPRSHPAARKRVVALTDLRDLPFFWNRRSFNPHFYDACARLFRDAGFRPRYVHVEPAQVLTLERIAAGEGCTLLNRWRTHARIAGLAYRPLAEGSALAMRFAAARPESAADAALERLEEVAARVLGAPGKRRSRGPGRGGPATRRAPGRRA